MYTSTSTSAFPKRTPNAINQSVSTSHLATTTCTTTSSTSSSRTSTLSPPGQLEAIDGAAPPVAVSPDTTERVKQFIGKWAFGFGAELLPYLGRREAPAVRLVSQLLHAAVDRRAWPVRPSLRVSVVVVRCTYLWDDMREKECTRACGRVYEFFWRR
jgi:hypothetical protein